MSDPLQSGLAAGQAAYSGAAPKRMGISAADLGSVQNSVNSGISTAAAQRQMVDTNAAKQAAGAYPTSGTSAAMYNYLRGQGGYPVNAVPSGQPVNTGNTGYGGISTLPGLINNTVVPGGPIQKPYEKAVNTGDPTQTKIAEQTKTDPTKMGTRTSGAINIPKPSAMQQILGVAGPAALGYYALSKSGGLDALGKGYDYFFPKAPTPGIDASSVQALADPATNPYLNYGPSAEIADASANGLEYLPAADAGAVDAGLTSVANGYGTSVVDGAGLEFAGGATPAGVDAGLTSVANGYGTSVVDGAGLEFAGGATGAGAEAAIYDYAATDAAAAGLSAGEYATMLAEYGPYVAAAIIADQLLLDGAISEGIGDAVSGIGGALEDVAGGIGDAVGDFFGGCFLTTAATEHAGEEDDGPALSAMRELRDNYMRKLPQGRKEIEWYYRNAPKIVAAIDKKKNAHEIYMDMYKNYIKPTEMAVREGDYENAHQKYNRMVGFAKKVSGLSTKELSMGKDNGIPKEIKKNFNTGGLTALAGGGMPMSQGISVGSRYDPNIDGISQADPNIPFQPTVGQFANGGPTNLGGYSDGGRLLRGPGDGVSDSIPAVIGNKQPARLADGEFVVPARIVSEIGNGSTEAGARKLYAMMDRVQKARGKTVGKGKVAKNTRADKYLPA